MKLKIFRNFVKITRRYQNQIRINFINGSGKKIPLYVEEGTNILKAAHDNDINLEGACGGALACATCHVILPKKYYDMLKNPSDIENDLLDTAYGLTETSRLGCQVTITKSLDGMNVRLPTATRNFAVDGYIPKPH